MKLTGFLGILLAFVLAFTTGGCPVSTHSSEAPAPAQTAAVQTAAPADFDPDIVFTTVDMDGSEICEEDFADASLTMINYWAYWCGPCVGEMPDLQQLYENYAERGFVIWGISDEDYEAENLTTIAELGISYPCLRYTEEFDPWLATGYIPTTIFVDSSGKVVGETYVGGRSYEDWAAIVEDLLP